ncbi:MlaD family protein [Legionella jordanis]|uniref:ABC transport system periplasmic substrate binding protein n=1 Tax=Legionella jordanis TaxID=456 RepID=A0A0W0VBI8_9GAMM|nr:MlaD family protein [Legionella jordanis]KTD17479.1 ABC transport system periplasmic substrate binding protein [Legionella jordanis]RMX05181.1 MCE family protein [Legionella jordanis]RMX17437.1 MCE family protein [Legionella jordanis]VEH13448.1 ABC transport system periplasmic substrate binding protein [Legionella jordanis]HAT8714367.1 MCE family protein [Legionella jordanis]
MEAKVNYTVVGIIVLVLIAGLIASGLWLSVGFEQKKYNVYEVYMHEAVSGLSNEAAVKFNGVQVGFVKAIELNQTDPQQVKLLLSIEEGTPITTSTSATLISQGITGVTYVGLSASSSDLTPLQKLPNQAYPVIPSKPSLFHQLDSVLKDVSENVNKVSLEVSRIFDKENATYIKKTLANFEEVTSVIAKDSQYIHQSLKNADVFLKNTAKASQEFPAVIADLKAGVKKFNHMANSLSEAGDNISETMQAGKLAISKISQQAVPPAVSVLRRLEVVASNLEKISAQMRQNPSVLIRGTKAPKPGPGE